MLLSAESSRSVNLSGRAIESTVNHLIEAIGHENRAEQYTTWIRLSYAARDNYDIERIFELLANAGINPVRWLSHPDCDLALAASRLAGLTPRCLIISEISSVLFALCNGDARTRPVAAYLLLTALRSDVAMYELENWWDSVLSVVWEAASRFMVVGKTLPRIIGRLLDLDSSLVRIFASTCFERLLAMDMSWASLVGRLILSNTPEIAFFVSRICQFLDGARCSPLLLRGAFRVASACVRSPVEELRGAGDTFFEKGPAGSPRDWERSIIELINVGHTLPPIFLNEISGRIIGGSADDKQRCSRILKFLEGEADAGVQAEIPSEVEQVYREVSEAMF